MNFKEFVNTEAFLNMGDDNQFFNRSLTMPVPTFEIPTRTIQGTISSIYYTKNPITIVFDNGHLWKVTKEQWDNLVRSGKEPRKGKVMQVEMFLDGAVKFVNVL